MPGQSNKCSITAIVECHACLVICLTHNSSLLFQAISVEERQFISILMQRSGVRGIGHWGILDLHILICASYDDDYVYETIKYSM
jgi:hypothetical protein